MSAYIVISIIAGLLNVAPFLWNIRKGNSAVICLGFWNIILPLNSGINGAIWRHDAINRAPIWCDISAKIEVGAAIGSIAAPLCIARFLAQVVAPGATMSSTRDKRNRAIFDYSICFGLPALTMALHYIWQPSRFAIARLVGCEFTGINVWPMYLLWLVWPPVLATVGTLYAGYVFYRLANHRRDWRKLVTASESALTTSRFIRLCTLCSLYLVVQLPLTIYNVFAFRDAFGPLVEYDWSYIHDSPGAVYFYPLVDTIAVDLWFPAACALIVAVFFGFSSESRVVYAVICQKLGLAALWTIINKRLGWSWPEWDISESIPSFIRSSGSKTGEGEDEKISSAAWDTSLNLAKTNSTPTDLEAQYSVSHAHSIIEKSGNDFTVDIPDVVEASAYGKQ